MSFVGYFFYHSFCDSFCSCRSLIRRFDKNLRHTHINPKSISLHVRNWVSGRYRFSIWTWKIIECYPED